MEICRRRSNVERQRNDGRTARCGRKPCSWEHPKYTNVITPGLLRLWSFNGHTHFVDLAVARPRFTQHPSTGGWISLFCSNEGSTTSHPSRTYG